MARLPLLVALLAAASVVAGVQAAANKQGGDLVALTDETFSGALDGDWLIAFTAPWCGHCKRLSPTFEKVATALKGEINVGKVDCTTERGLAARFAVTGFPSIFMVAADGSVTRYDGARSVEALTRFARGGWRDSEQLGYWASPMGPLGRTKGFIISSLYGVKRVHSAIVKGYGVSPLLAALGLAFAALISMFLIALAVAWCNVKESDRGDRPHQD